MDSTKPYPDYFLEVVRNDESPVWPVPEEQLNIFSQPLTSDFTQYWAYPKDSDKGENDLPRAESLARINPTPKPAILIDQKGDIHSGGLELVLVSGGHAFARTISNLENLEDNLSSTIDYATSKFNIKVEHFLTTENVSVEVEKALDELERGKVDPQISREETNEKVIQNREYQTGQEDKISGSQGHKLSEDHEEESLPIRSLHSNNNVNPLITKKETASNGFSKWMVFLPIVIILATVSGVIFYRDKITAVLSDRSTENKEAEVIPIPTPTLTPTPALLRSNYKIRVLNGTTKAGAAKVLADKLKEVGWEIEKTGNNKNQTVAQTTIRVKEGLSAFSKDLISDLGADYEVSLGGELESSDTADGEVVIGKR